MSPEQWPFWAVQENCQQICEQAQKDTLNLTQIQHQNGHYNHMGGGFPQSCGDHPHAAFTLGRTEPAFYFHAFAFIPVILRLISGLTLLGTPQRRIGEPDSVLPAITEIFTGSVDLVRQNVAEIMTLRLWNPSAISCRFPASL